MISGRVIIMVKGWAETKRCSGSFFCRRTEEKVEWSRWDDHDHDDYDDDDTMYQNSVVCVCHAIASHHADQISSFLFINNNSKISNAARKKKEKKIVLLSCSMFS